MDEHVTSEEGSGPTIAHTEGRGRGEFRIERGGKRVAEITYERTGPDRVTLDHTFVDASLRGQGVGKRLVDAAADWARRTGTKLDATCPYARKVLDHGHAYDDVKA